MRLFMLILHFVGLALSVGTGFAYLFLGLSTRKMDKDEARELFIKTLPIQKMSHIGLFLLIVSGGYLMTPYWDSLTAKPVFTSETCLCHWYCRLGVGNG